MPPQLQSKFISTYGKLLQTPATVPPTEKRFWDDVFCLTPDVSWLRDKMRGLGRAGLLGTHQHVVTCIFAAAKDEFSACSRDMQDEMTPIDLPPNHTSLESGPAPEKETQASTAGNADATSILRRMNAARTLQAVAQAVLGIPGITGWEIMDVLAGGVGVSDAVFTELVGALVHAMENEHEPDEMRHSALQLSLALACGFGQLSPGNYLLAQDMFPAIVSLIRSPTTTRYSFEAFLLLAILANYHRADAASLNPYLKHIQETGDVTLMHGLLWVTRYACARSVKVYRDIHDDTPPSFTSTMSSIFSVFRPAAAPPPMKELFSGQPIEASVILFPFFEHISQNRAFRAIFAETIHPDPIKSHVVQQSKPDTQLHQNIRCASEFVSLASYILAHAGSTSAGAGREEGYAGLVLDILERCVADEGILRAMCSPPVAGDSIIWLCRQRLPLLPLRTGPASFICSVVDVCILYLRHNLSKKLDSGAYETCVRLIRRTVFFLQIERIRIDYHWSELWRAIVATLVFLLSKQDIIVSGTVPIDRVIAEVVQVLDLAVACADGFLPSPEAVHQLVYEMVRASPTLRQLTKRERGKYNQSLQDLLMTIEFYENQLEGTNSAENVIQVLAREIERDGVYGISAREREEPGSITSGGDVAFVRWACFDGLALVS
ncbi:putative MFS-1 domain protein [Rhizoctonia solani 123E]|uniref:Putative MFS-1 domain protein n=1 Tax=Rhizoctonia solani 123E TaxID=1423351 RepID=A0A074RGC9_9AGAM|nr:putative MFS-1 domain protein [Rhizoctonia solani 123E]